MSKAIICLGLALTLAVPAAAADKPKRPAPLATAGAVTVSPEEFALFAAREIAGGLRVAKPEVKRELLVRLTVRKALAAKAENEGLDKDPVLAKSLNQWKFQNYPERYWSDTVDAKVKVSEKELWDLVKPVDEYHLGAISLGEDAGAAEAARQVMMEFSLGVDFSELARKYSLGLSAAKGGDIGWQPIPNRSVTEAAAAAIRATKVGQVTGPVETPIGTVIYLVREARTAAENFERFKADAEQQLLSEKRQKARAERAAELRAKAEISYPAKNTPGGRGPLAVVNGSVILPEALGVDQHVAMSKAITTFEKKLEALIDVLLVVQDAERRGLDRLPELQQGLALERTLVLANLALRRNIDETPPTDAEIRAEYARYYVPEVYALQMVTTTSREQAAEALKKIREGQDFGAVAKQYGKGRLSANDGKLAPGPIVDYAPAVRKAIEGAPDGGVTGVVELSPGSFGVIKRIAKKTIAVPPFDQVSTSIRMRLATRRRADQLEKLITSFAKDLKITVNEELLATL